MKLVIASGNAKKRSEIERITCRLGIDIVPLEQTIFVEVVEDGRTFSENAAKKARAFAKANNCAALADDSGLCVEALGGAPGVMSARYAGDGASDEANILKLLEAMKGIRQRRACFYCHMFLALPNGEPLTEASGKVCGEILETPKGRDGFGYDPVFYCPELGKTFAEATPEEKDRLSHRGKALRALSVKLARLVPHS
ncbi:MAG: RdgB/HAM1 family non-canonical purine NTP pyrophosphatase [Zetaproteobacteria bacterium]|nr:MAG: RdgB/HAM1 family non-canonical purine NTP pyrophosphatase [Zetaproteobacteria bacterium]